MKIRQVLKQILPDWLIAVLKMGLDFPLCSVRLRKLEKSGKYYDLLLGTPLHTNLGDHLITMAEREMLNQLPLPGEVVEIPTEGYLIYKNRLKRIVDSGSTVYINGGGWMGNLWPDDELLLQDMVDRFKNNKTIVFPQTIFYDKKKKPYRELLDSAVRVMAQNDRLYLFVRDRSSCEFAEKYFEKTKICLCPDIALSYERKNSVRRHPKTVGYCLRDDRELVRDDRQLKRVRTILRQRNYHERTISTMSRFRVPSFLRKHMVHRCLHNFSCCSLVVTDRLHGMIFAYITRTPCIIFDNKTRKVSGVYQEWLSDVDWIYPAYSSAGRRRLISFIESVENRRDFRETEKCNFDELREMITNG